MNKINLVFPHQLFKDSSLLGNNFPFVIIEENLFFNQYNFHKQKIAYHRATMEYYKDYLEKKGREVIYIQLNESERFFESTIGEINEIHVINPIDDWLEQKLSRTAELHGIKIIGYESPMFLNLSDDLDTFFKPEKKKFFQTSFYQQQRKRFNILLDEDEKPTGGKWSFDAENRKKYPKKKTPPSILFPAQDLFNREAKLYTETHFGNNLGATDIFPIYPNTHESAELWLDHFLETRFFEFGPYEDAIVANQFFLNHSVLTPMLNVGLLTPQNVIELTLTFVEKNSIPINSIEGFIRQIIGWREFMRGMYVVKGRKQRTTNFWGFKRKIPASFYDGTTGILPIDTTIKKVLRTGYCHHIERLMILGNFMVLCEFDPDEVYRWFMEFFIDAYDWVMVPNVYGMSQFADGGLLSTKPYISGSNYLMKMSDYPKGEWQNVWDALFWRFMNKHRKFFLKNPRLGMLIRTFDKMDDSKKLEIEKISETYLNNLQS